jgi:hypothetical protein
MESKFMLIFEANYPKGEKNFDEFLVKRAVGAKKIEKSSRQKGGYSILTAYHFAGKKKPYADSKKWESKEDRDKHYKQKAMEALAKLKNLDSLSQKEFQTISGEFEVYGEVYIRSKKGQ